MIARSTGLAAGLSLALAPAAFAEEKTYSFSGFTSLDVSAGIELIVETGTDFAVRAESPRSRGLRQLEIELDGDTLTMTRETSWSGLALLRSAPEITVHVTLPDLTGLNASSGSSANVASGKTDAFEAAVSSGASVRIDGLDAARVSLDASSGGTIEIAGTCGTLSADGSSGASLSAGGLECTEVSADASSGASLSVHATGRATADASSGGSVRVDGNPGQREESESSGGSVVFR